MTNGSSQEGEEGVWEEHEVRLRRGDEGGFGFAVTGVEEEGDISDRGVRVEDVVARGPAEGKLKLGDTIVRIGGKHLAQLQYGEAIQVRETPLYPISRKMCPNLQKISRLVEPFILEKIYLMCAGTPRGGPLPLDDSEEERSHLPAKANSKVSRLSFP